MRIYFAGPLFTTGERMFNAAVVELLRRMGHGVCLPQETEQRDAISKVIFRNDVDGINWADVVVANMDGADPDSGTCWECGFADGKKPVILYRTDTREEGPPFGPYNLMLHQAATATLDCKWDSCAAVAAKIDKALRDL